MVGHTLCQSEGSHQIVMSFSPPVVGCLLKTSLEKGAGVTGTPGPPLGYAPEEAVKRVFKWAAAYYTHPNSYYKLPTSHAVSLQLIKIPKPTSQEITRNEEAQMRAWANMHGKSVRQRNVRQDNTMYREGT